MKSWIKKNRIALKFARFSAVLALAAGIAAAEPVIMVSYDPGVGFTNADKAVIQDAVNFYESNITSTFTLNLAFGSQAGGGATSEWFTDTVNYTDYYAALVANSSGDVNDTSAIASLGGPAINNPVTGTSQITLEATLATDLGLLGSNSSGPFSDCGGLTANACITLSTTLLNTSGTPPSGLLSDVEHELDEVLGTSSALPNGGGPQPTNPFATDLFRYSAPGVRGFAQNTSTDFPCSGTPTAYFSIDGGTTNLQSYNNCNNGGDYGDWYCEDGSQVQCFAGPDNSTASLSLSSPEVTVLDAVGYNFVSATPEPGTIALFGSGLAALIALRRRRRA